MATDKDRLLAALGIYRGYISVYHKAVHDKVHVVSEDENAFWAVFRAANNVANLLNNMIEWDEIILLDEPVGHISRDSEDVLAEIKAKQEKLEAWLSANRSKIEPKRESSQVEQQVRI